MGVSGGGFSLRWLSVMTSLPAGVRSAALLCRDVLGGFWQRQPENKQGRVWGLFSFRPLCSLHQTPSASQPTQIWYGAVVGNGLSGARYVSVSALFMHLPVLWVQEVHGPSGSSWDWGWKFCDVHRDSSFCSIVYAHLCYNRELFKLCRTIIAPSHACLALFIPSPKKPLYLTSALIVDLENMRVDCWT